MNKIGSNSMRMYVIVVIIEIIIMVACVVLSIALNYRFLIVVAAVMPGLTMVLSLGFVSYQNGWFVVRRIFRRKIEIEAKEFERIAPYYFVIPFSNLMKISFKDGRHFLFLGGGKNVALIRSQVQSFILSDSEKK